MQKAIIIINRYDYKLYNPFYELMKNLILKYDMRVFIFSHILPGYSYIHDNCPIKHKEILKKIGIYAQTFETRQTLSHNIKSLHKKYNIIFIDTFINGYIPLVNTLRKENNHMVSREYTIFNNKSQQRHYIKIHAPELDIPSQKCKYTDLRNLDIKSIIGGYPCIVKPNAGVRSEGVSIIRTQKDLQQYTGIDIYGDDYVVEKFIEGKIYSIDCYVTDSGNISYSCPTSSELGNSIGINTMTIYVTSINQETLQGIDKKKMEEHIKKIVVACGIFNTFICYEFKVTPSGKIVPIEINGRIGWLGLKDIQETCKVNLYELLFLKPKEITTKIYTNISTFLILSPKDGIFKGYNMPILQKIQSLHSFDSIDIFPDKFIEKEVKENQQGSMLGQIIIKNNNFEQYKEDYNFIMKYYHQLTIVQ